MPHRNGTLLKSLFRTVLVLAALVSLLLQGVWQATAQAATVLWSTPVNLSNTPQSSVDPAIIADDYGNIHVFWSEDAGGDALRSASLTQPGNTIYYRRWDGTTWSQPNDILLVPDDPIADYISVAIDKNDVLHAVWTGQSNIYYSNAPLLDAGSARAWRQPVVITPSSSRASWEASIAADKEGNIHIAYATRGSDPGVFHVESTDNGTIWSQPNLLSEPFDSRETAFSHVKLISDTEDRLHAVWQTTEVDGYGQSIYYARSVDHGDTWSRAAQMAYRQPDDFETSWPYIMNSGPSELHLIYGAGSTRGRYERISRDGGATWSDPQYIIPEMEGVNGYIVPLIDGAGQLHLIIDMRPTATQKVGIYYSSWTGTDWSPVVPLVIDTPAADSAHYAAAVVIINSFTESDIHQQ